MTLRDEAILMLENRGAILATARKVSHLLQAAKLDACVIGGVAVYLHGYARTTKDVDVFIAAALDPARDAFLAAGFTFDPARREFLAGDVPVHLVAIDVVKHAPQTRREIDAILTVELSDLIDMKLRSGTGNVRRTQDIADVVGLISANGLTSTFAAKLSKDVRPEFRRLVKALR